MDAVRVLRAVLLLGLVLVGTMLSLATVVTPSGIPAVWPAAGLVAGCLLMATPRYRGPLALACVILVAGAFLTHGYAFGLAAGYAVSTVAGAWVVPPILVRGLQGRAPALLDQGDVSRMIGAILAGSLIAAAGYTGAARVTGTEDVLLAAVAAAGAHAASMMVLLPLFLQTPRFAALAGPRERLLQGVVTLGTTVVVFYYTDAPPVMFAVMPMFAWHAFRGTLREATLLLCLVGATGSVLTAMQLGPVYALSERYGLAPELAGGVLQLFLLDCGLILLPLSVMATQQRMSAASAAAEREKLERLVSHATGTAVIATGADGRVVLFNPGAEAMLGYTAQEVVGRRPEFFLSESELRRHATGLRARPTFVDICRASVALGDTNRLWWFERRDGERRSMRMTLTAVPDERGLVSGYLATAEDVTEREAAHQALLLTLEHERTAGERLRELERVKSDFVATVSHELRTPITSIMGYLELLEDGAMGDLTDPQAELVSRVDRNSRRLLLLVEDLLTLSQIESSRLTIEPVDHDLREVVTRSCAAVAPSLSVRQLDVEVDLPEDPVVLCVDPTQMERMLTNLVSNAVKFTPDGGRVVVELESTPEEVRLVVSDTGLGIPENEQEQLFTRFFRSSVATERAIQGTGLGLTIVQAIVALHRGVVRVSSAQDEGTTVVVTLPRPEPVSPPAPPATAVEPVQAKVRKVLRLTA